MNVLNYNQPIDVDNVHIMYLICVYLNVCATYACNLPNQFRNYNQ